MPILTLLLFLLTTPLLAQGPVFIDATEGSGLQAAGREPLLAVGDYDGDGDPDVLVDGRRLFRNDSEREALRFTDVTEAAGLDSARGPAGQFFDFDLDGRIDIATSSGEIFLQGKDGRFTDYGGALKLAIPHGSTSGMAWGDVNQDGFLDLFCGGNNTYNPSQHYPQALFLNRRWRTPPSARPPERLKESDALRSVLHEMALDRKMYGRSIVFCDFDEDGDQDLYSGNYHLKPNYLLVNTDGWLEDRAGAHGVTGRLDPEMFTIPGTRQKIGFRHGHTIGAAWADLDGDGHFDLWVSNLVHKYAGPATEGFKKATGQSYDARGYVCDDSNLFINQGPPDFRFEERRAAMGIPPRPIGDRGVFRGDELWSNAVCGDLDLNGCVDVFCNQIYGHLNYSHGVLYANDHGTFSEVHAGAGIEVWGGYGAAIADLDSDGRLDLLVCGSREVGAKPGLWVFHNRSPERPWIGFDLQEQKGRQVVGARVLLLQEGGVQVRQVATSMGSHSQQSDGRVHFGLGDLGAIEAVHVLWPNGLVSNLGTPSVGRYHPVRQPRTRVRPIKVLGPRQAVVGQACELRVAPMGRGFVYEWDIGRNRGVEARTDEPSHVHVFESAGRHRVSVRGTRPRGSGRETSWVVEVREAP